MKIEEHKKNDITDIDLIKLINLNKWKEAIELIDDPFRLLLNKGNIFHHACNRGNYDTIMYYINLKSDKIYKSDAKGKTGVYILFDNYFDEIGIYLLSKYPDFLIYKNRYKFNKWGYLCIDFCHNINIITTIINLMIQHKFINIFNELDDGISLLYLLTYNAITSSDERYLKLIKLVYDNGGDINIGKNTPLNLAIKSSYDIAMYIIDNCKPKLNIQYRSNDVLFYLINSNMEPDKMLKLFNKLVENGACIDKIPYRDHIIFEALELNRINIIENIINRKDFKYNLLNYFLNNIAQVYISINYVKLMDEKSDESKFLDKLLSKCDINNRNSENRNVIDVARIYGIKFNYDKYIDKLELYQPSLKIKMPEALNDGNKIGISNNSSERSAILFTMIAEKYSDCIIPMKYPNRDRTLYESHLTSYLHNYFSLETKMNLSINSVIFLSNYYNSITPAFITWLDKDINSFNNNSYDIYLERALNSPERFIIMYIMITYESISDLHANTLIYDKKRNILLRFEPNGYFDLMKDAYQLDLNIMKLFKNSLKNVSDEKYKNIKYLRPCQYLNDANFQTIDAETKNLGDPDGYCMAWSLWFLELKMLNPDLDEKILVENAMKNIIIQNNDYNKFKSTIRDYAKRLHRDFIDLYKRFGISEDKSSKKYYDNRMIYASTKYINSFVINKLKI